MLCRLCAQGSDAVTEEDLACAAAYGDRARQITRIAEEQKLGKRLVRGHPMLEAEVIYACRQEFCEHAEDFIARRTRLAFLDTAATEQALPRVRSLYGITHVSATGVDGASQDPSELK